MTPATQGSTAPPPINAIVMVPKMEPQRGPSKISTTIGHTTDVSGVPQKPLRGHHQTWVRGGEADGRNFANISIVYNGQIRGVCLSRGRCRRRFLDQEDLLRH
jgi:hypothetical protein